MSLSEILKTLDNPNHHAYLVIGNVENNFEAFRLAFRKKILKNEIEAADVSIRSYQSLSIDDARAIKDAQSTLPIGERRFVLISIESIQHEAQNSLLKLFEESVRSVFIICARHSSIFLPTLLSRFYILESPHKVEEKTTSQKTATISVNDFLPNTISGRVVLLEPIIKEKDKILAENFLNDLESTLHKNFFVSKQEYGLTVNLTGVFEAIFASRRFLRGRSPSVKMILENICGIVPIIKVTK